MLPDLRGIAVIMISGEPNSIDGCSPYPFLQKPFDLTELEAALHTLLSARAAKAESVGIPSP